MTMIYIILIVIAVLMYLIYKGQSHTRNPKHIFAGPQVYNEIKKLEGNLDYLLMTNPLKDFMQSERVFFELGRTNFFRLSERFKHDALKLQQIASDWIIYMKSLTEIIHQRLLLDVSNSEDTQAHWDQIDELQVKIDEIEKRFKTLLGNDYIDPYEQLKPKSVKQIINSALKR